MKRCPKCGTEYPDSMNFCLDCGKKLETVMGKEAFLEPSGLDDIRNSILSLQEEVKRNREELERVKSAKDVEEALKKRVSEVLSSDELRKAVIEKLPKDISTGIKNQTAEIEYLRKTMQGVVNEINKSRAEIEQIKKGVGGGLPGIAKDLEAIKSKMSWLEGQKAQAPMAIPANMQMLLAKIQRMERDLFMLKSAVPMVIE